MSVQLHISSQVWVVVGVYKCATSHFILGLGGGGGVQVCNFTYHSHFILDMGGGGGVQVCNFTLI